MIFSIEELGQISRDIETVIDYLTDNSCGDPECCGGPYVNEETYLEALTRLADRGIEVDG